MRGPREGSVVFGPYYGRRPLALLPSGGRLDRLDETADVVVRHIFDRTLWTTEPRKRRLYVIASPKRDPRSGAGDGTRIATREDLPALVAALAGELTDAERTQLLDTLSTKKGGRP